LNRDQFAVVLATLRRRFREGEWIEGQPLPVGELAEQCGVSATPIREALSRLAGEGLVEDRRGRGYHARRLDGVDLADLYRSQHLLAHIAARSGDCLATAPPPRVKPAPQEFFDDPVSAWESLFEALMRQANAGFLLAEQRRLADLLAPARRLEPQMLEETVADFAVLTDAACASDWPGLMARLGPFFRRRREAADAIVGGLRLNATRYKSRI
jgi:DNA-binding transcriptional ArsR family regulator